jgi:acyl-CoA thioester hydrolase
VEGYPFVHRDTVRYRDVDAWGHVNNAVYLTYCEDARMAYLAHLGLMRSVEEARMILARAEIDFRSPTRAGESLEVGVRAGAVGTKSFVLEYAIHAPDRLVAESRSVLVAYDYERAQAVEIPDEWRSVLEA